MLQWLQRDYFWRQLHLWSSLIIGLQLIAWFASGLVMSVLPIDEVRGQHLRKTLPAVNWQQVQLAPQQILAKFPKESNLSLSQRGSSPLYVITTAQQTTAINALTGLEVTALSAKEISDLAMQQYRGSAELLAPELLKIIPNEARGLSAPIWRVKVADTDNSSLYLDPMTGLVQRVPTDTWRVYDFFWMLHIMDYQNREDFNHALLIICTGSALLFSLSGIVLLIMVLRRKWRHSATTSPS